MTPGAYGGSSVPQNAAFVVKLTPDGLQVLYSAVVALIGDLNGLAVDTSGGAYLTGSTYGPIVTTPGVVWADVGDSVPCTPFGLLRKTGIFHETVADGR